MQRRDFLTLSAGTIAFSASSRLQAGEISKVWSGWRGPSRDGMVDDSKWPTSLDPDRLALLWSKPLGDSYSGPVTAGDLVFSTESKAGKESTMAFHIDSGEQIWKQEWKGSMNVPFFAARNGNWIRSTPVTDETTVYVGGMRDVLVAMDAKSGTEKWRLDFGQKFGKLPDFGMVCSPLIDGEHLYVQAGKGLHKLNRKDGSIVWSSLSDSGNIMSSGAFSSPVIATLNGIRQLIVQTRTFLAGVDLATGDVYWKYEVAAFRGMNILTPTVWKNAIFTSSYGGRSLLLDVEENKTPKVRWENKIEGYMSSPVVIGDHLYMHLKNKRFGCLDLATGKEAWITKPFGEYWSTLTNGQSILALDQTGSLRLISANPAEFQMLSERQLTEDEEAWAHVGVLPQRVIVRTQNSLRMYRWM